jgi:hypothetical protein
MKQFMASPRRWPILLFALIFLAAGQARAACSNPTGNEADMIYNGDYHTYQFCDGTTWRGMGGGGGSGGLTLISTQTASGSAVMQFTSLPTGYNTLFLNCTGLLASNVSSTTFSLYVGEGAGPTWETSGHYTIVSWYEAAVAASISIVQGTALSDMLGGSSPFSNTVPTTFKLYIDNVGSSSIVKNFSISENLYNPTNTAFYGAYSWGYWNNDTNPITGLEIVASGGTISSGTCSLYGMN